MACPDLNQILISESGRISGDIYRKTLHSSPWLALTTQKPWEDEMGDTISHMVYERALPESPLQWTDIAENDGLGNSCLPPTAKINFGQTLKQANLQHAAIESPDFCVNDLRFALKRQAQLKNIYDILAENTTYIWNSRYRSEYVRLADHKVIAAPNFPEASAAFPIVAPISRLTATMLRRFYQRLVRDNAGFNPLGRDNGRPVFGLITDSETSWNVIMDDYEIRKDFRDSSRTDETLAAMGIDRSYNGFYHMIDDFMPRYDLVDGVWVERLPYKKGSATKGNKWDISEEYENAEYMDSIIYHKDVFESLIPRPISTPGGNTKFDPNTYRGTFEWKNIIDRECNPDGTVGFFRGVFSSGSRPLSTEFGIVIRHLRCDAGGALFLDCDGKDPLAVDGETVED